MIYMVKLTNVLGLRKGAHPILGALLILYIVVPIGLPQELANFFNGIFGRVVVLLLALSIFTQSNAIVGILAIIAAYTLIKRSEGEDSPINSSKFIPSEVTKASELSEFNQFPVTLEEEVVSQMAPLVHSESSEPAKYKPVAGPIHDAVSPDYQGTI